MTRISKGPWDTDGTIIFDAKGNSIAEAHANGFWHPNAVCMAASREMYDAAREILSIGIMNPTGNSKLEAAKRKLQKAVRKVEGA